MHTDLVDLLSFVELLGGTLTIPVAVLAATALACATLLAMAALVCAVFLTWLLASWFIASVQQTIRWSWERYATLARQRRDGQDSPDRSAAL